MEGKRKTNYVDECSLEGNARELDMPQEITDTTKFLELAEKASECRVKRSEQEVKLKLRTTGKLYTIKLPTNEANSVLEKIKCQKVEL